MARSVHLYDGVWHGKALLGGDSMSDSIPPESKTIPVECLVAHRLSTEKQCRNIESLYTSAVFSWFLLHFQGPLLEGMLLREGLQLVLREYVLPSAFHVISVLYHSVWHGVAHGQLTLGYLCFQSNEEDSLQDSSLNQHVVRLADRVWETLLRNLI